MCLVHTRLILLFASITLQILYLFISKNINLSNSHLFIQLEIEIDSIKIVC